MCNRLSQPVKVTEKFAKLNSDKTMQGWPNYDKNRFATISVGESTIGEMRRASIKGSVDLTADGLSQKTRIGNLLMKQRLAKKSTGLLLGQGSSLTNLGNTILQSVTD